MKLITGLGLGLLMIIWLALELATVEDRKKNLRSFSKAFRRSLLFVISLFVVGGGIYILFFN